MNRPTSAHHGGMPPPPQLARYGSAPGSFLAALADSVSRGGGELPSHSQQQQHHQPVAAVVSRFFSGESSGLTSCESSCRTADAPAALQRAYGGSGEIHVPPPALPQQQQQPGLLRHSSSPAGLLSRLMADPHGNGGGMGGARGGGMGGGYAHSHSHSQGGAGGNADAMAAAQQRRLSSQWSFSRQTHPYFMQFMIKGGFMCTHTPKITGVSEGGSAVFKVNYFKEHTASLAQSPQLYKQMLINGGINRVFEIGPVFRAEDSNTHRHLCEYIGLHAEMQIKEHYFEVIDFVDSLFVDIFDHLAKNCSEMLDMIQEQYPCERLKYLQQNVRLKYSEGIEMLQESGFPIQEPQDLNNKAELMLGQLVLQKYKTDFFILYEYPLALRPFYTMPSAEKRQPGSYSNSFDAFIRGQEVLSGSQRIHDKSLLIKMIDERGYNKTTFQQFSNTFGCGAPPRGGFGVGLERLVMLYLGVPDFRIASLFPRDPGRLAP